MGIFQRKQEDEAGDNPLHFFDDYFREELRQSGRQYFEKVIDDNATLFKKDLDATITQINADLKEHITTQLDATLAKATAEINRQLNEQFVEYGKAMKETQDAALETLNRSAQSLLEQHQQLGATLQSNMTNQESMMSSVFKENMARITETKEAQDMALLSLNRSAQALQEQHQQLSMTLQKNIAHREAVMVGVFEENMAQIIEHYLLGALGDQYDLKAQLPSIIQQMEANKHVIVDDMKL